PARDRRTCQARAARRVEARVMLVALVDFATVYMGETVHLRAGYDWVADGHEIHREHPEKFTPDRLSHRGDGRPVRRRGRGAAVGRPAAPLPAGPSLRGRAPSNARPVAAGTVRTITNTIEVDGELIAERTSEGWRSRRRRP